MTRRRTPGSRRTVGARLIRTDQVRYPSLEREGSPVGAPYGEQRAPMRSGLGPVRDAGLALGDGRRARDRARRRRVHQQRLVAAFVIFSFAILLVTGFRSAYTVSAKKARQKMAAQASAASGGLGYKPAFAQDKPESRWTMRAQATPVFASWKNVELRLPVPPAELTEIGFHQAARTYALHMKTKLPTADLSEAKHKGTGRAPGKALNTDGTLNVSVLRMWRSRPGKPDSAVDVGAVAGTVVYAPVSGKVIKVKKYKLYGRIDDYEIHIRPDGRSDVDVVLIHIDGVTIKPGDTVQAGLTQIGAVRKLHDKTHHQLADYMNPKQGKGDHVHIQLNNTKDPTYKGLEGAIEGS